MIYTLFLLIFINVFILIKEKGLSRYFVLSMILGWTMSLLGFTSYLHYLHTKSLYIFKFGQMFNSFFRLYQSLKFLSDNPLLTITLMILGNAIFIYSCICFSISLTKSNESKRTIYLLLAIIPAIQVLLYSPYTFSTFYYWYFQGKPLSHPGFAFLLNSERLISTIFMLINYAYVVIAIFIIIHYFISTPSMKHFRIYLLTVIMCFFSNVLTYLALFWWTPKRLISCSVITNHTHVLPFSVIGDGKWLFIIPFLSIISCVVILTVLYKYNNAYIRLKQTNQLMVKAFSSSGFGSSMLMHNLKSYIVATLVDAEFLKEKHFSDLESTQYLDRIIAMNNTFLDKLNEIREKLKDISLYIQSCDIKPVLYDAINSCNLNDINIIFNTSSQKLMALIDPNYISDVIKNIVQNAIDSMVNSDEKRLTISLYEKHHYWVIISFSDTGCGMDSNQMDQLFTPFVSSKATSSWGLGLSYCYKIINSHKGKINVESKVDKGTTFEIFLPRSN